MKHPTPPKRRRHQLRWTAVALMSMFLVTGCAEQSSQTVFDEISRMPTREELIEIDFGHFIVPVPVVLESATGRFEPDNLMQIQFQLFGVMDPEHLSLVESRMRHNAGRLRDRVITVCRSTTRDDLMEPLLATLKAHLLDAIQPLLGGPTAVRRVGVRQVIIDEL